MPPQIPLPVRRMNMSVAPGNKATAADNLEILRRSIGGQPAPDLDWANDMLRPMPQERKPPVEVDQPIVTMPTPYGSPLKGTTRDPDLGAQMTNTLNPVPQHGNRNSAKVALLAKLMGIEESGSQADMEDAFSSLQDAEYESTRRKTLAELPKVTEPAIIQGEYGLKDRAMINAGARDVAGIEDSSRRAVAGIGASADRDVAHIGGRYDIQKQGEINRGNRETSEIYQRGQQKLYELQGLLKPGDSISTNRYGGTVRRGSGIDPNDKVRTDAAARITIAMRNNNRAAEAQARANYMNTFSDNSDMYNAVNYAMRNPSVARATSTAELRAALDADPNGLSGADLTEQEAQEMLQHLVVLRGQM